MNRICLLSIFTVVLLLLVLVGGCENPDPMETASVYIENWSQTNFHNMYSLLSSDSRSNIDEDNFISRYQNIYSVVDINEINITTGEIIVEENKAYLPVKTVFNTTKFQTFEQEYTIPLVLEEKSWKVEWSPALIFPALEGDDKVTITELPAKRGDIATRNGTAVAIQGNAYTVGVVPGKISNRAEFAKEMSPLLELSEEFILKQLDQKWIQEDTFVPLRSFPLCITQEFKDRILSVKGTMLATNMVQDSRRYLDNDLYAHVIGYVQRVSAEDLKNNADKGYQAHDLIGRSGIESAMEDVLYGRKGYSLQIRTQDNEKKAVIAEKPVQNGNTVVLTLDPDLQLMANTALGDYKGAIVVLEPKTGEVLAMVSHPTFNPNEFPNGILPSVWDQLSNNPDKPFINRSIYALYPPGSSFKPFSAAIALEEGVITPNTVVAEANKVEWRPSSNWNAPPIRRVQHPPGKVNLDRALVWSDNIYFAWASLKMKGPTMETYGSRYGIGESLPFPLRVSTSQIKSSNTPWSPHLLASTGYGQGEVLISPLQMAAMYTAFANNGNIMLPQLIKEIKTPEGEILESFESQVWKENAIPAELVNTINSSLINVIEDETGTGHNARIEGLKIAGKTGTAQRDDSNKEEISWFIGFTLDTPKPLLICIALEVPPKGGGAKLDMARNIFTGYYFGGYPSIYGINGDENITQSPQ